MISRRSFLKLSAAGAGLGIGTGLYTWRIEPHWVQFVERPLVLSNLPRSLAGSRLVQLSDLHIGPQVDDDYLLDVFDRVRELAPEFVVYTGDFTTHHARVLDHVRAMFLHLPLGLRGTFGILGNHDYGPGWSDPEQADEIARAAGDVGVRMLRNETVDVDGLHIVGMEDLWAGRFDVRRALDKLPAEAAAIALSHNPDTVDLAGWDGFSGWILAGHTHGGQCKPPFLPPPLVPVQNRRYTAGEFRLGSRRRLYINRGLGHLLKVRFNVRPEVTVFHLAGGGPTLTARV